jgi:hypothetical protein
VLPSLSVRVLILSSMALATGALPAAAQTCTGGVDIRSSAPAMVGGGIAVSDESTAYMGSVGGGNDAAFIRLDGGASMPDSIDATGLGLFVTAGGQVGPNSRRMMVCPVVEVGNFWTIDIPPVGVDVWTLSIGAGVYVGVVALDAAPLRLIPTFGVGTTRLRARARLEDARAVETETWPWFELGVGLGLHDRATITPSVAFSDDGYDGFGLTVQLAFPRR